MSEQKTAIIIGAGPAGLTAAYELLENTDIKPVIFEKSDTIGGICKTATHNGYKIDIGGHRFFSKSDRVMKWWADIMPIEKLEGEQKVFYRKESRSVFSSKDAPSPENTDLVMLVRKRKSRIYFLRKFFDYPLKLNFTTLKKLGTVRTIKIGFSYLRSSIFPKKTEENLEDFFINRFGRELYLTFFKSYTEKVWGVPCNQISAEWGAQRIKGLSLKKAVMDFFKKRISDNKGLDQKETEDSLIEKFLYPKLGPGQMWERVAEIIKEKGGQIYMNKKVDEIKYEGNKIRSVGIKDAQGEKTEILGDYFFSTMPVKELISSLKDAPKNVQEVADGLVYRDFVTVGLLMDRLTVTDNGNNISDNWIYIQDRDVKLGRLQIFNNWSPYLVRDKEKIWLGLEYFCSEGDELWEKHDTEFIDFAIGELEKIGIIAKKDVRDSVIIRMKKTYPAYFGTYERFQEIKDYINTFENLFLIGRNGMHRYNNQDHSMLTAMAAVENIISGIKTKENIWSVNTEEQYHEKKNQTA